MNEFMREIDDMGELIKEWHDKANQLVHLSAPLESGEDITKQLQQVKVNKSDKHHKIICIRAFLLLFLLQSGAWIKVKLFFFICLFRTFAISAVIFARK